MLDKRNQLIARQTISVLSRCGVQKFPDKVAVITFQDAGMTLGDQQRLVPGPILNALDRGCVSFDILLLWREY